MLRGIDTVLFSEGLERVDVKTDILVVGGSGAAISAATKAASFGLTVTVVSKGRVGKSGNAIISTASIGMDGESAYSLGERRADRRITRDVLFDKIVKNSFYLADPLLVRAFVENCGRVVGDFVRMGREMGEPFMFMPPAGWITTGKSIGQILKAMIRKNDLIRVMEDTIVIDLLVDRNPSNREKVHRVAGGICFDLKNGRLVIVKARSVIIASGGYQPYSFKCTASDVTGDGIAMAMRLGARVSDMEFQLFLPGVMRTPLHHRGSIFPFLWYVGGFARPDITNNNGNSIVETYFEPELLDISLRTKWFKLIHTYYWGKALDSGAGGIFFDFRNVGWIKYWFSTVRERIMLRMLYGNRWHYQGEDFKDLHLMAKEGIPWEVGLSSEYSMGGIVVDNRLESDVDGLFVAGEASSGLFGAFRGENGLTEMLVMGELAGKYASEYAVGSRDVVPDEDYLSERLSDIFRIFNKHTGLNFNDRKENIFKIREELEKCADKGLGFIRKRKDIERALKGLQLVWERLDNLSFSSIKKYDSEFLEYLQVKNLLLVLESGLKAALMRKESRGMHIRSDYPEVDHDRWLKRITISLSPPYNKRTLSADTIDIGSFYRERLGLDVPSGRDRNIIDYIMKRGMYGEGKSI